MKHCRTRYRALVGLPNLAEGSWDDFMERDAAPCAKPRERLDSGARPAVRYFEPLLTLSFVLLIAVPVVESPDATALRAARAQELTDELRAALSLNHPVAVNVVIHNPLVFSVEPVDAQRERFVLSMELGFLQMLDEDELRAALVHELGHVWIFTNHPYLQTERLANTIGQRVVGRQSFERVYSKLWAYEGTSGVPFERLLGPHTHSPARR